MPGITIVGLGPGDPAKITREAWEVLAAARTIWLRTREHPAVASLPASAHIQSFDLLYEHGATFEEVYTGISRRILELGRDDSGVVYAVPGHPFVAEATVPEIARQAREANLPLRVVDGVSFLGAAFSALGIDPYPQLSLCDALTLGTAHVPLFPPDVPALIAQIYSRLIASEVKIVISQVFPDEHPVRLVHAAGTQAQHMEDLPLYLIDRSEHIGGLTCLYVPPLEKGSSLEAFQEVVAHLRAPEGCPWDRKQTHASLRAHLLEESYEAISAMDSEDFDGMREEFGDLLLQIMLNAQIASEEGQFTVNDVIRGIHDKIVRRHPHVFGNVDIRDVDGVLLNWERLTEQERAGKAREGGLLGGVPASLPALTQAQEYQERTARVGFDWTEIHGVIEKIAEEVREVEQATDNGRVTAELGDLFFALVNFARWKGADAESALREANSRFRKRFEFIEQTARQQGLRLSELTLERMDAIWQEAKKIEAKSGLPPT
ncbi:MAG: nucleoside triphosphate pyrophosphohydrolase [Anaerolineales bacterium]